MLVFSLAIRYIFGETLLTIFGFSDDINATTSYGPPPVYHAINDSTVIRFQ